MAGLRTLASQTAIYGISSILGRVINWGLTPFYTHYFVTGEFGILSDLYAFIAYPLVLLTFGMETTFFRWAQDKQLAPRAYANAFWAVAGFTLVCALFCALSYRSLASALGYAQRSELLLLIIGIFALDCLAALPKAKLRHQDQALRFAGITLLGIVLTLLLNIVFVAVLRLGIAYIFVANLIASAITLLLVLWRGLPQQPPDPATLRPMLGYGFWIMLAGLLGQLNEMLDKNLLPRLWPEGQPLDGQPRTGAELNGIYNANYKLGMLMALATQAYRYAMEPFFFRKSQDAQSPVLLAKSFHYFITASLVVFLVVSSFRWELVSFTAWGLLRKPLFDPAYWAGIGVVPIVLLANCCLAAYINLSIWFKLTAQVRFGLLFTAVGAAITVLVNIFFTPHYGYWASASAHLLCYATMAVLCYAAGQHYRPMPYAIGRLGLYAAVVFAAFVVNEYLGGFGQMGTGYVLLKVVVVVVAIGSIGLYERKHPALPNVQDAH